MARKPQKLASSEGIFPVSDYWEDYAKDWPGERDQDYLGADHEARFFAVGVALKLRPLKEGEFNPIITREQLESVVAPLSLKDPAPLVDKMWAIAGRHLRPAHRLILGSDPKATSKVLNKLARASAKLERIFEELPVITCQFLTDSHLRLPHRPGAPPRLDLSTLDLVLGDLHLTAALAASELERDRKRPILVLRRQALFDLVKAIEAHTDLIVERKWVENDEKVYEFKGAAGPVVLAFMRLVDPKVTERSLVKLLTEVKAARKTA